MVIHDSDGLVVEAERTADGGVVIRGRDTRPGLGRAAYTYVVTVAPQDVPTMVAALAGGPDVDPVWLLSVTPEVVETGERSWLEEHEVPHEFHSRSV